LAQNLAIISSIVNRERQLIRLEETNDKEENVLLLTSSLPLFSRGKSGNV